VIITTIYEVCLQLFKKTDLKADLLETICWYLSNAH